MKRKLSSGFTLIELLVVIAIIGILAALVLVALGNARDKAQDAKVKSNIGQLRTLAEIYYDSNGFSYAALETCIATPTVANCPGGIEGGVASINSDFSNNLTTSALLANDTATAFCMSANLISDTSQFVCVDATGNFAESTTATCGATATSCP